MKYTPHPYQEYCIDYLLSHPAAGLFLKPGMGKTSVALTAADRLLYDTFEATRVLVIAPLRVAEDTWSRESEKWDHLRHLRVSRVLGDVKERRAALRADADIYCINRENVDWLVKLYGTDWPFDLVIVDELSSFRNPSARRFRALRKVPAPGEVPVGPDRDTTATEPFGPLGPGLSSGPGGAPGADLHRVQAELFQPRSPEWVCDL